MNECAAEVEVVVVVEVVVAVMATLVMVWRMSAILLQTHLFNDN